MHVRAQRVQRVLVAVLGTPVRRRQHEAVEYALVHKART